MPSQTGSVRAATKAATREALIAAALAEITEHGPVAPSLDAICARAGKTRGAFYVHFRDREALVVAVMDRVLGDLVRSVAAAGTDDASGGLAGAIRHFSAAAAARAPSIHAGRGLRFHHLLEACRSSRTIGDRYRAILTAAAAWAARAVDAEQRAGRLRDVESRAAGDVLLATSLGLVAMLELDLARDPVHIGEALIDLLGLGLGARRRRARRTRRRRRGRWHEPDQARPTRSPRSGRRAARRILRPAPEDARRHRAR
jgi:AcrR family transcriptional regulator